VSERDAANDTEPSQSATMTTDERQQSDAKATLDEMMAMSFFIEMIWKLKKCLGFLLIYCGEFLKWNFSTSHRDWGGNDVNIKDRE
jgi:hypothetical protein